ncbi:MAG TPA: phosphatase PAP2 family protein [Gemmatimonadaceae bacterium]|nr:phosphatase PAP2 family protein [Gemmatimonadaceae bacterium]
MKILAMAAIAVGVTLGAAPGVGAQSVGRMLESDVRNLAKDVGAVWASPFDSKGRDWLAVAGVAALTGVSMFADEPVERWARDGDSLSSLQFLDPLRRGGVLFSGKYIVPPVAAAYILGIALKNQGLRDGVLGCGASWLAQSPVRKGVYRLVGRQRPETSPDDAQNWVVPNKPSEQDDPWQYRSFPAGHFANAMGCAAFLNNRFDMGWGGPAIYAVALGVGMGRLLDHAHWTSDTVLGGALGYAVGREIGRRSLAREMARSANGAQLNVAPDAGGLSMTLQWTF